MTRVVETVRESGVQIRRRGAARYDAPRSRLGPAIEVPLAAAHYRRSQWNHLKASNPIQRNIETRDAQCLAEALSHRAAAPSHASPFDHRKPL